ncbi:MAG TPA: hypothetical protein VGL61_32360 [Kofleriaceae bacterium]|jgi:hypothetical protein
MEHLDETGRPCTRHAAPSQDSLLALALLGSRMPSFHHDLASKLQSLMMAVEEIDELAQDAAADMRTAIAGAGLAVRELQALFAANRTLARPPQPKPTPIGDLIATAAHRAGTRTHGELPAAHVDVSPPAIAHAIAIVLDLAAGSAKTPRALTLVGELDASHVVVTIETTSEPLPPNAGDLLALAGFAFAREHGELRCGPASFSIRLPLHERSLAAR